MPRTPDRLRRGAEQGVAQVLTPAEALALLDRLADAEAVEQAAEKLARSRRMEDLVDRLDALDAVLDVRRTFPPPDAS